MNSILRSTAILGASTIFSILARLVATKLLSALLGPDGFGYFGLVQNTLPILFLLAGMGIGTGMVALGQGICANADHSQFAVLTRSAWLLTWIICGLVVSVLTLFSMLLGGWIFGRQDQRWTVILIGAACERGLTMPARMLHANVGT